MTAPAALAGYVRPETVEDALEAMASDGAIALAGGTDVVPLRTAGLIAPALLVDVKRLPELARIERRPDALRIGATATMRVLLGLDDPSAGALADAAAVVGGPQTRARATVGGNVCRSSPGGDTLAPLLVLAARAELLSRGGHRTVPLDEFFLGPGRNVRAADELLGAIDLGREGGGSAYERFTYRAYMDLAVVGAAAWVSLDEDGSCDAAAVAICAAAPVPLLVPGAAHALTGSRGDGGSVALACDAVVEAAVPIDDVRGTRRHRLRALRSVCRIAVERAFARAGGPR
jgi:carbon-monoxide dehydrogenase medium subunit